MKCKKNDILVLKMPFLSFFGRFVAIWLPFLGVLYPNWVREMFIKRFLMRFQK